MKKVPKYKLQIEIEEKALDQAICLLYNSLSDSMQARKELVGSHKLLSGFKHKKNCKVCSNMKRGIKIMTKAQDTISETK